MTTPIEIPNLPAGKAGIRIITISGRIASGSTTLAKKLSVHLGWKYLEGGEVFWEHVRGKLNLAAKDTNLRPDSEDELFDKSLKKILNEDKNIVLESKLAGFNAQNITGIFKILVMCEDNEGNDQTQIRIDRLVNRENLSTVDAKEEVLTREKNDIEKWQRLYAKNDPKWTYWNHKYYDLIINTYFQNQDESLTQAIEALENKNK